MLMKPGIIAILSVVLSFFVFKSHAQSWTAEFENEKFNEANGWYYTDDFVVNDNVLRLNGNIERSCTVVEKLVTLPEKVRYKGIVSIGDNNTSVRNNFYVLLAMTSDRKDKKRRFVALSFGEIISLVEITHTYLYNTSTKKTEHKLTVSKSNRVGIYERYPFPSELLDKKICFDVVYDQHSGWDIKIYTGSFMKERLLAQTKTKTHLHSLAKENFIGFAVNYTKERRDAFSCHYLSVSDVGDEGKNPDGNIITPKEEDKDDFDNREGHYIVLSEIMAKPESGASEYIEIYNPTQKRVNLENYHLVYSSGKKNVVVPLGAVGVILPDQYMVLSTKATGVSDFYKDVIEENCVEIKLPVLSNEGFEVGLAYGDSGTTFDDIKYSPDYFPKGYKSKSGISLQRIDLKKKSTPDNWEISIDDAFRATPTRGYKKSAGKTDSDDGVSGSQDMSVTENCLYEAYNLMKSSNNKVDIQINIYDVNGSNLFRYSGEKAKHFLKDMVSTPQQVFSSFGASKDDTLLMSILFRESKEGYRKFVYKFRIYPN